MRSTAEFRSLSAARSAAQQGSLSAARSASWFCNIWHRLRGQGQGWVLQDSPVCHGLLLDPPLWHNILKCRAKRGTGGSPTVPRDTQGESCRTQPWPWPRSLCHILQNHAALRAALILPCCAALRAALRLRNSAVLRTAGPVIYCFSTFRLAVWPT